uniref:uncharacterized protein LOC132693140 n=1 Tax=Panthera onca TaxID=9690 RepID=UPI0029552187|nr:uncharacterized protein LOC132693140 [Panthera onca]
MCILRSLGILVPCQSPWNTPLLPVKKPHTNDYRPVQDLREVNKRVTDIHPTVPNRYTLLSSLAPSRVWYTVLDLKDAFFSLPLAPQSQPLFAFKWHDPEEGYSGQLTWTRLPQGFKNSPTIFNEALHEDLGEYRREHPGLTLLQYVDDILIAADTAKDCERGTQDLLATLGALGYRASTKKAQICRERIHQRDTKIEQVVSACKTCQLTNARATSNKKGTRLRGTRPGAQWEVDFTEVKPGKYGFKYLLVFTDTFSGWVEAYPTKHETAQTVAKKLLEDILPSGLQRVHEDIWPRLRAIYEAGPTQTPHQYRPGDWVYVKRHHGETLEPRWKGPYIVVLTTPTALKVDGIATWVHHTHVRPADPSSIRKDFVPQ